MDSQLVLSFQNFLLPSEHYINVINLVAFLKHPEKTQLVAQQEHFGSCPNNRFQDFQIPTIRAVSLIVDGTYLRLNDSSSRTSPQAHVKPMQ